MDVYNIVLPEVAAVPVVFSSPHSGTFIPQHIKERMVPELVEKLDETDWYIDRLFDFVPAMGITMITANYSRWVVDLNRDRQQQPLYNDGRIITGLVPLTNFDGIALYTGQPPTDDEINERIQTYYDPYHQKLESLLQQTLQQFGIALLLDGHSIKRYVPGIQQGPFPDIILSDNDQLAASGKISKAALEVLRASQYQVTYNNPFKGGHITRSFGKPTENRHAIQLELVKTNYMDDAEMNWHEERADTFRELLQQTILKLVHTLS